MTKYVIIVPDGAADEPLEQFDGKTPFEAAKKPNIDKIRETFGPHISTHPAHS